MEGMGRASDPVGDDRRQPSAGKSPALGAVLPMVRSLEREARAAASVERDEWKLRQDLARITETTWKEAVRKAIRDGEDPPARPEDCDPGPEPHMPRLMLHDATIERVAMILSRQSRDILQVRDELAGWLEGMARYSAASDRPFWIESYGGRSYVVERLGRDPVDIEHLSVAVIGGIQPDRLRDVLRKAADDGLFSRFLPFWPDPVPLQRPRHTVDFTALAGLFSRLHGLLMPLGEDGRPRPWFVPFDEDARALLDDFRRDARKWEGDADGLLLSWIGKTPGFVVRLALILACLDAAAIESETGPETIGIEHVARAAHFIETYALPMARRVYGEASMPRRMRLALEIVRMIADRGWERFTVRDILRMNRSQLRHREEIEAALCTLEDADAVRVAPEGRVRSGGRPTVVYTANPALRRGGG